MIHKKTGQNKPPMTKLGRLVGVALGLSAACASFAGDSENYSLRFGSTVGGSANHASQTYAMLGYGGLPIPVGVASNGNHRLLSGLAIPDSDADGLSDAEESRLTTDPNDSDTDNDNMPDGYEVTQNFDPKDPLDAAQDADSDALENLGEFQNGTDPHVADTDSDGLQDGDEIQRGTDPKDPDSDGDGQSDGDEVAAGRNPLLDEATAIVPIILQMLMD